MRHISAGMASKHITTSSNAIRLILVEREQRVSTVYGTMLTPNPWPTTRTHRFKTMQTNAIAEQLAEPPGVVCNVLLQCAAVDQDNECKINHV